MTNIYQFTFGEHIKLILILFSHEKSYIYIVNFTPSSVHITSLKSFTLHNEFDFTRIFSFQLHIFSLSTIFNPLSSLSHIALYYMQKHYQR